MTVSAPGSLNKQKSRTHKIKSHPGQAKASTRKKLTRHKIEALSVTRDEYFELLSVTDTAIAAEAAGLTVDNFIAQQHQLCEEGQKKARRQGSNSYSHFF